MFVADLKGKLSIHEEHSEDFLTSAVFSIFDIFPKKYLSRFLGEAVNLDGEVFQIKLSDAEFVFWKRFSPKESRSVEPDVLIFANNLAIIIEAKLYAGKSGTGFLEYQTDISEKQLRKYLIDQLAREYYLGIYLLDRKKYSTGSKSFHIKDFYVLYVTKDSTFPENEINDTINEIKKISQEHAKKAKEKIYWTNWQTLIPLINDIIENTDSFVEFKLASQLKQFLLKRSLMKFSGFRFLEEERPFLKSFGDSQENLFYIFEELPYFIDPIFSESFKVDDLSIFYEPNRSYFNDPVFSEKLERQNHPIFYNHL